MTWWNNTEVQITAFLVAQLVKNPPAMHKTQVQTLGWEDTLEKVMATHSNILAWRIPMDRGAWRTTVHRVAQSRTQLGDWACTHPTPRPSRCTFRWLGNRAVSRLRRPRCGVGSVFLQYWDLTGMQNRSPWNRQQFQNSCSHFTANSWSNEKIKLELNLLNF